MTANHLEHKIATFPGSSSTRTHGADGFIGAEAWVLFKGQRQGQPPHEANHSNHSSASDFSNLALTTEGSLFFCFGLQGAVERHRQTMLL